ncbi:hypothetical protein CP532_0882 [Ophiocordyceps camponoti-leonardi (nom. inval.)]|nr:hypothetical protein CP532_0882 [Ophiocordyceps camponoti-leonardi (nom. inval.)]
MLANHILSLVLLPFSVTGSRLAPPQRQQAVTEPLSCGNMKDSNFARFLNHTVFTAQSFNTNKPCVTWECVKLVVETLPDEFIRSLRPTTGKSKYRLIEDIVGDLSFIPDERYGEFLSWVMAAGLRRMTVCWLSSEMDLFRYYEDPLGAIAAYLIDPDTGDGNMYQRFTDLPVGPLRDDQTLCFSPDDVYYRQIRRHLPELQARDYVHQLAEFKSYDEIRRHTSRWGGLFGRALFEMTQQSYSCSGPCGCDPSLQSRPMIPQSYSHLWATVHWLMERNKPFCLSNGRGKAKEATYHYWIALRASNQDLDGGASSMEKLLARQAALLTRLHAHPSPPDDDDDDDETDRTLLRRRLKDVASVALTRLYAWRFESVPRPWLCLYTDALILSTYERLLRDDQNDDALDYIVETLDRVLITTGAVSDSLDAHWVEETMQLLEEPCGSRQHLIQPKTMPTFSPHEPMPRPQMKAEKECPRLTGWTLDEFERYVNSDEEKDGRVWPVVFTDLIRDWPALTDRPWRRPDYLLSRTMGGRRLVPVEIGRSYVDDGWGQELMPFGRFLSQYVLHDDDDDDKNKNNRSNKQTGYLAQHNLFHQIPSLRRDVTIPDFCWSPVPPHPTDPSKDHPRLDTPQLNAWFGPAATITPLHTDGYHNLLCQVVGTKYVRLYPPQATPSMCPREAEAGVDMSNTSSLDLGLIQGWDRPPRRDGGDGDGDDDYDNDVAPLLSSLDGVDYRECILQPGDTLFIPIGWWHYVRSLSISFSLSFWWN